MFHILRGHLAINCLQCTYLWPTEWKPSTSCFLWKSR